MKNKTKFADYFSPNEQWKAARWAGKYLPETLFVMFFVIVLFFNFQFIALFVDVENWIKELVNSIVPIQSIYREPHFSKTVFRIFLFLGVAIIFVIFQKVTPQSLGFSTFFLLTKPTAFGFVTLFIFMLTTPGASGNLPYNVITFLSLIGLIMREQLIFFCQVVFIRNPTRFILISVISICVFIFLHPLEFSVGRVSGTILMISMWIYTSIARNVWMGVLVHAAWNFIPAYNLFLLAFVPFLFLGTAEKNIEIRVILLRLFQHSIGRKLLRYLLLLIHCPRFSIYRLSKGKFAKPPNLDWILQDTKP